MRSVRATEAAALLRAVPPQAAGCFVTVTHERTADVSARRHRRASGGGGAAAGGGSHVLVSSLALGDATAEDVHTMWKRRSWGLFSRWRADEAKRFMRQTTACLRRSALARRVHEKLGCAHRPPAEEWERELCGLIRPQS